MALLGILLLLMAPVALYFAFHPKKAFYFDEGWKFRSKPEPSDAYIEYNRLAGFAGAIVLVAFGIFLIVQQVSADKRAAAEQAAERQKAASHARCESEIKPRFDATIKWDANGKLANPQEVQALADQLHVTARVETDTSTFAPNAPRGEQVWISDPTLPGGTSMLSYFGVLHGGTMTCS